jgi:DNA-binding response OmpR family regulator
VEQEEKMDERKGCRILVIDDMPEMQDMLALMLSHERNDHVIFACGGYEGLSAAQQEPPHLIILDLMMPDLSGYEVFKRLKELPELGNVPVLLLTVLPPQLVYPKARPLGVSGYVCKPFEFRELLRARDTLLRGETYFPPLPDKPQGA